MSSEGSARIVPSSFRSVVFQGLAALFCIGFGIAIIVNVELAGNALWFWYAKLLHQGVKLYSDLHIVLQPLFVLEYNAWMQLVGVNCIRIEILSLIHVVVLILGMFLLLREASWPDWQKAIVLVGVFFMNIQFNAYLFNDYHITSDICSYYSILLLMWLARTVNQRRAFLIAGALGMVAGLSLTNRLNDGAGLICALVACIPFVARRRKAATTALAVAVALLTILVVVHMTGDTFHAYLQNSVFGATGSKGGGGKLLADPFLVIVDAVEVSRHLARHVLLAIAGLLVLAAWLHRRWKMMPAGIFTTQVGVVTVLLVVAPGHVREGFFNATIAQALSVLMVIVSYALVLVVSVRWVRSKFGAQVRPWDRREAVVALIFLLTAAGTGSTGGHARDFFFPAASLLLLVPVLEPFKKYGAWVFPTYLTVMLSIAAGGVVSKEREAYEWHNYRSSPMFTNRSWYDHPVYGEMYMENDQRNFIVPLCDEIRKNTVGQLELLSLPYPYPNYFCDVAPWHGYVQTFYDTSPRATIEQMMRDLEASPPQWIIYQRELKILALHEQYFNQGQRLAQRDLDEMIEQKIASGQWQLFDKKNYLEGDGWLIIWTKK